jgi:hypothetical protein
MTKPEWERVLDVGRRAPQSSIQEIIQRARTPEKQFTIVISIDPDQQRVLERAAERRKMDVPSLVKSLVEELVEEEASE